MFVTSLLTMLKNKCLTFLIKKNMWFIRIHYENLQLRIYLRLGLKLKNISCNRTQSISMAKTICWYQQEKKNRSRKRWRQSGKYVVQINEQCCAWKKKMENVRNGIYVKLFKKTI